MGSNKGGVMIVSYSWADDARKWDSMSDYDRFTLALENVAITHAIHGKGASYDKRVKAQQKIKDLCVLPTYLETCGNLWRPLAYWSATWGKIFEDLPNFGFVEGGMTIPPAAASYATQIPSPLYWNFSAGFVGMSQAPGNSTVGGDRRYSVEKAALALGATSTSQSRCIAL